VTGSFDEIAASNPDLDGARAASASMAAVLARAAHRGDEGGRVGDREGHDDGHACRYRRRERRAEQRPAGPGDQRRGQVPGEQAEPGRRGADSQVLGEQHAGDDPRRAPGRLEQARPPDLLGHPAAHQDGDAPDREEREQPARGQQGFLLGHDLAVVRRLQALPVADQRCQAADVVVVAGGCEGAGLSAGGEPQVDQVR
jgi:hypothetical protein